MTNDQKRFKVSETISGLIYTFLEIDPNANFTVTYEDGVFGFTGAANIFDPEEEGGENENGNAV